MKHLLIFLFLTVLATQTAIADESFLCTYGQKERIISLIYQDPEKPVPCEVRYKKEGLTEILWKATNTQGFCETKIKEFVQKQIDWGWRCADMAGQSAIVGTHRSADTDAYIKLTHLSQALAAVSPFKAYVTEYYMMQGKYPENLEAIGVNPADVKTSSYFSDLILGESGTLYVIGNEKIGDDLVISLKPKSTLGGASLDWKCTVNVKFSRLNYCEYDKDLNI